MIATKSNHALATIDSHASRRTAHPQGLDSYDIRILEELQVDASRTIAEIGTEVNLSQNACWRRIKRLEDDVVTLRVAEHSQEYLTSFAETVSRIPEIVEFYRLSGEVDYLIKVHVSSIGDYDRVYKKLIKGIRITDISSSFAMEKLKSTTALPVRFARHPLPHVC
jgi:Lrp/AsnC family transcriptional regulator